MQGDGFPCESAQDLHEGPNRVAGAVPPGPVSSSLPLRRRVVARSSRISLARPLQGSSSWGSPRPSTAPTLGPADGQYATLALRRGTAPVCRHRGATVEGRRVRAILIPQDAPSPPRLPACSAPVDSQGQVPPELGSSKQVARPSRHARTASGPLPRLPRSSPL